jgi:hypothetical protein
LKTDLAGSTLLRTGGIGPAEIAAIAEMAAATSATTTTALSALVATTLIIALVAALIRTTFAAVFAAVLLETAAEAFAIAATTPVVMVTMALVTLATRTILTGFGFVLGLDAEEALEPVDETTLFDGGLDLLGKRSALFALRQLFAAFRAETATIIATLGTEAALAVIAAGTIIPAAFALGTLGPGFPALCGTLCLGGRKDVERALLIGVGCGDRFGRNCLGSENLPGRGALGSCFRRGLLGRDLGGRRLGDNNRSGGSHGSRLGFDLRNGGGSGLRGGLGLDGSEGIGKGCRSLNDLDCRGFVLAGLWGGSLG